MTEHFTLEQSMRNSSQVHFHKRFLATGTVQMLSLIHIYKYVWDNSVDDYILLKSNEEYFNDPVCKNGYFRGVETYNFVKEVMSRGEVYKKKIKD